jgi:hypothetical protein
MMLKDKVAVIYGARGAIGIPNPKSAGTVAKIR